MTFVWNGSNSQQKLTSYHWWVYEEGSDFKKHLFEAACYDLAASVFKRCSGTGSTKTILAHSGTFPRQYAYNTWEAEQKNQNAR